MTQSKYKYIPYCSNPKSKYYEDIIKNLYYYRIECDNKNCLNCKFMRKIKELN